MTRHHVHMFIDTALSKTDDVLQLMFGGFGPDIRHELEERKEKGELLIGCVDCEGFDPVKGCPGHPVEKKEVPNA